MLPAFSFYSFNTVVLSVLFLVVPSIAQQPGVFLHFSTCTGVVDNIEIELDFFEEIAAKGVKPTGHGYFVQTAKGMGDFKTFSRVKISTTGDQKKITMFSSLAPNVEFSQITVNTQKSVDIQIRARNFGNRIWGQFKCTPSLFVKSPEF